MTKLAVTYRDPSANEIELLTDLATNIRLAFEKLPSSEALLGAGVFPRGWCGYACDVLGAYLVDNDVSGFEKTHGAIVLPEGGQGGTHVWLERQGLIVDITADQFVDNPKFEGPPVYVSFDRTWHASVFPTTERTQSDFRKESFPSSGDIYRLYGSVLQELGKMP